MYKSLQEVPKKVLDEWLDEKEDTYYDALDRLLER